MSQENVEIVRRLVDAFNDDDVGGVIAAFDENCELHEPPEMPDSPSRGFRGHDGIRAWMANLRAIAVHFEPRSFQANGDVVLSEWAASGRGQASDVAFEWTSFVVFLVRDGKVVRAHAFLNEEEAVEAAGQSAEQP
jgi:ketosteroid isomerase-like protein